VFVCILFLKDLFLCFVGDLIQNKEDNNYVGLRMAKRLYPIVSYNDIEYRTCPLFEDKFTSKQKITNPINV
jgi:hypothetical protein